MPSVKTINKYRAENRCLVCGYKLTDIEREQAKRCWKCRTKRAEKRKTPAYKAKARLRAKQRYEKYGSSIKARRKADYERRKAAGICARCPNPAPDRSYCDKCEVKNIARRKRKYQANKLCKTLNNPVVPNAAVG